MIQLENVFRVATNMKYVIKLISFSRGRDQLHTNVEPYCLNKMQLGLKESMTIPETFHR